MTVGTSSMLVRHADPAAGGCAGPGVRPAKPRLEQRRACRRVRQAARKLLVGDVGLRVAGTARGAADRRLIEDVGIAPPDTSEHGEARADLNVHLAARFRSDFLRLDDVLALAGTHLDPGLALPLTDEEVEFPHLVGAIRARRGEHQHQDHDRSFH